MTTLEESLFQNLAAVCTESRQAFDRRAGMTQARRHLLVTVSREGELSHAALRQQLALHGATVTRLVKQFEADGLLRRRLDPSDNRYTLVCLTDSGEQFVAALDEAHGLFQTQLLAGISFEEQATIVRLLEHLRSKIRMIQDENREEGIVASAQKRHSGSSGEGAAS